MPWVGKGPIVKENGKSKVQSGVASSELGYLRDHRRFWQAWKERYEHLGALSKENIELIEKGKAPIVDEVWIQRYPQHAAYKGQILEHHHIGQGATAVPVPKHLHDAYSAVHPRRQTVARPGGPMKDVQPPLTRAQTDARVARHAGGNLRAEGVAKSSPPPVGEIPPSSLAAGEAASAAAAAAARGTRTATELVESVGGKAMAVAAVADILIMIWKGGWETPGGTMVFDKRRYFRYKMWHEYGIEVEKYEGRVIEVDGVKIFIRDGLPMFWDEEHQRPRPPREDLDVIPSDTSA
jgi:hypothetical protein